MRRPPSLWLATAGSCSPCSRSRARWGRRPGSRPRARPFFLSATATSSPRSTTPLALPHPGIPAQAGDNIEDDRGHIRSQSVGAQVGYAFTDRFTRPGRRSLHGGEVVLAARVRRAAPAPRRNDAGRRAVPRKPRRLPHRRALSGHSGSHGADPLRFGGHSEPRLSVFRALGRRPRSPRVHSGAQLRKQSRSSRCRARTSRRCTPTPSWRRSSWRPSGTSITIGAMALSRSDTSLRRPSVCAFWRVASTRMEDCPSGAEPIIIAPRRVCNGGDPIFLHHDQIEHASGISLGGGLSYQLTGTVDVYATYLRTVLGHGGHKIDNGISFGFTWGFSPKQVVRTMFGPRTPGGEPPVAR